MMAKKYKQSDLWKKPNLDNLNVTDAEKAIAAKYTRIQPTCCEGLPEAHNALLVVNHQSFIITKYCADTVHDASVHCLQFAKAMLVVIQQEREEAAVQMLDSRAIPGRRSGEENEEAEAGQI